MVSRTSVEASAFGERVRVDLRKFQFRPRVVRVKAGRTTLLVHNRDPFLHTFTIPALGVDRSISPGSQQTLSIDAPVGTYIIYCKPHSDVGDPSPPADQMIARLIVN